MMKKQTRVYGCKWQSRQSFNQDHVVIEKSSARICVSMQCLQRLWPLQFAQFGGSAVVPGQGECLGQNCAYGGVNLLTLKVWYTGTTVFEY